MIRPVTLLDDAALGGPTATESSGFGALETEKGRLPLVALDVRARVTGLLADITVRQTFRNSLDVPLEATYIFPLPDRAAVTSFRMRVGERVVEGVLKERGEARAEYIEAISNGYRAGIAEEERSGTFSLRVGNIPPKETISVELTLVGMMPFVGGQAEFRFPLVVAPRYVPGVPLDGPAVGSGWGADTDQVPDASRVTPPVLLPGFPNPVRLSLEVELDPAGLDGWAEDWAGGIRSSLHSVIIQNGPPWIVRLQPGERLERDFILRYPLASDMVQTSLVVSSDKDGQPGTFALVVVPPAPQSVPFRPPRDIVFVLDRSGSMEGWKMVAARRAVERMIETLLEHDRFTVVAFDDRCEFPKPTEKLLPATREVRSLVQNWVQRVEARGGTDLASALRKALELLGKADEGGQRVVVLVTDGQVAGEDAILRTLAKAAGGKLPRIYTVGIDQAVNAGFLRRLADQGGGWCELVESESQLDAAMDRIHRNLGQPLLTQLRIEPALADGPIESVVPSRLPDVFADRPITVFGRVLAGATSLRLRLVATDAAGGQWSQEIVARPASHQALKSLWGRARVRELEDLYASGLHADTDLLARQIVETSLSAGVLSRFTAYVAVDRSAVVNPGGQPVEIVQPVEMPAGWKMHLGGVVRDPICYERLCFLSCLNDPLTRRSARPGKTKAARSKSPRAGKRRKPISAPSSHNDGESSPAAPKGQTADVAPQRLDPIEAVRKAARDLLAIRSLDIRKERLADLVKQLELLLESRKGKPSAEQARIRDVLRQARQLLASAQADPGSALEDCWVRSLVGTVEDLLRNIAPTSAGAEGRKFWM